MATHRWIRWSAWVLAGLVGAGLIAAWVGPRFVDTERLRVPAEQALSARLGRPVRLERLSIALLPAPRLAVDRVEVGGKSLSAHDVVVPLAWGALLAGRFRPAGLRFHEATIETPSGPLLSDVELVARARPRTGGGFEVQGRLRGRTVRGGTPLEARFDAALVDGSARVGALDARLGPTAVHVVGTVRGIGSAAVEAEGRATAERMIVAGVELRALDAPFRFAADRAILDGVRFELYGGVQRGTLEIDTADPRLPFRLRSRVDGAAVAPLLAAAEPSLADTIDGTASLELDLQGDATRAGRSTQGTAIVTIRDGRLASAALVGRLAERLGSSADAVGRLDAAEFERLSATFAVAHGMATTRDLALRSGWLDLDGGGTIGLDGRIDLHVQASPSRGLAVPLRIRGTVGDPSVSVDVGAALAGALGKWLESR